MNRLLLLFYPRIVWTLPGSMTIASINATLEANYFRELRSWSAHCEYSNSCIHESFTIVHHFSANCKRHAKGIFFQCKSYIFVCGKPKWFRLRSKWSYFRTHYSITRDLFPSICALSIWMQMLKFPRSYYPKFRIMIVVHMNWPLPIVEREYLSAAAKRWHTHYAAPVFWLVFEWPQFTFLHANQSVEPKTEYAGHIARKENRASIFMK